MSEDPLARPAWNALTGAQAALATRSGGAVRIDPAIGPFAAMEQGGDEQLRALTIEAGGTSWLLEAEAARPSAGMTVARTAMLTQMIALDPVLDDEGDGIVSLGERDAGEMFTLARATQPGPWESATHCYGGYYGIHDQGRLVAMAGTRLRPSQSLAEVSGVCTDPAARGRGHARRLMIRVMRDMADRGETPFLHSYSSNHRAIALYRTLGFEVRRELVVSMLEVA